MKNKIIFSILFIFFSKGHSDFFENHWNLNSIMHNLLRDEIRDINNALSTSSFNSGKNFIEFEIKKHKFKISYEFTNESVFEEVLLFHEAPNYSAKNMLAIQRRGGRAQKFSLLKLLNEQIDFNLSDTEAELLIRYENRTKNVTIFIHKIKTTYGSRTTISKPLWTLHIIEYENKNYTSIEHILGGEERLKAKIINMGEDNKKTIYFFNEYEINFKKYNNILNSIIEQIDIKLFSNFGYLFCFR